MSCTSTCSRARASLRCAARCCWSLAPLRCWPSCPVPSSPPSPSSPAPRRASGARPTGATDGSASTALPALRTECRSSSGRCTRSSRWARGCTWAPPPGSSSPTISAQTWKRGALTVPVSAVLPSRYPQSDPTVFAATSAGLLRSPDGGRNVRRHRGPRHLGAPPRVAGAGAGDRHRARGAGLEGRARRRSPVPGAGLPAGEVRAMALSSFFAVDPVLFAAVGAKGVYRSSDGGATWTPSGLEGHTVTDLVWLGPFLYAAGDRGLFRSEDAGRTWSPLGEGLKGVVPVATPVPARARLGRGGVPGHRPGRVPHRRRRDAVGQRRAEGREGPLHRDVPAAPAAPERQAPLMRVAKAHGLGNDFLLVPGGRGAGRSLRLGAPPLRAAHRDGRRRRPAVRATKDGGVRMRLINADGGEAEISANGLRCLAAFRVRAGAVAPRHIVTTGAGPRAVGGREPGRRALPRRHRPGRAHPRERPHPRRPAAAARRA